METDNYCKHCKTILEITKTNKDCMCYKNIRNIA